MPTISREFQNVAFYLYPSEHAAKVGELGAGGGSGFFVGFEGKPKGIHLYAVTAKHVIEGGNSVLRINTTEDECLVIPTQLAAWTKAVDDDLAIIPMDSELGAYAIPTTMFLPEHNQGTQSLEVGDEAVLIGRLVTHEGRQRNKPVSRFGNISMMADATEPIHMGTNPDGSARKQVAFLVDCRSLSGASGSAVFGARGMQRGGMLILGAAELVLLGLDCAHLPFWTKVCQQKDRSTAINNMWVESNSGIAVVVPAWRIMELLNQEKFVKQRDDADAKSMREAEKEAAPIPDAAEPDEQSFTKDDFEEALKKASRKLSDGEKS